jgi:hypothetical protein
MNAKSAHALLLRSRHRHVVSLTRCHWISVKEGNSAWVIYKRLRVCVRRWVKHFKDGNTDIADQPRCGRPRTAATERNQQKVDELMQTRSMDNRKNSAQLGVRHYAVQEMTKILGYRKVSSRWVLCLLTGTQELLSHPPYSPDLTPVRLPLVRALERSSEMSSLRDWRGSPGSRVELERTSTAEILQRWQKCINRDGEFAEK